MTASHDTSALESPTLPCVVCGGSGDGGQALIHLTSGTAWRRLTCEVCEGLGVISRDAQLRIALGRAIRAARINGGRGLREEAKRLGVRPSDLSSIEHGTFVGVWPESVTAQLREHVALPASITGGRA